MFKLNVLSKNKKTRARVAELLTPHGIIQTPCYIPVGTQAAVKALTPKDLKEIGSQIVLANTYHLLLRPGADVIEKLGGLHAFMAWDGPIMTDSGGFQVFSLGVAQETAGGKLSKFSSMDAYQEKLQIMEETSFRRQIEDKTGRIKQAKIDDQGVTFYSHIDGSEHWLDPKSSIKIQEQLGADLIVAFDDHESPLWEYDETKKSLERSNRWCLESLRAHKRKDQLMYGVTHGGVFEDLRVASAKFTDNHFPGIAIGGAYTSKEILYKVIDWTIPYVADEKPRHLLGIGEVQDIFEGVTRGIDFFDCVAATRRARHGNVYISPANRGTPKNNFSLQITNEKYVLDKQSLDPGCTCYACQHFTRGYINHLIKAREILGLHLATYHNVYFITNLMKEIRKAIVEGQFTYLKNQWIGN